VDEYIRMAKKRKGTGSLPFGRILAKIMEERRLTLREIAALAGVSVSVVENWISGSNPHDLKAIDRLSQKLAVPFKKLLLGIPEVVDAPNAISEIYDEQEFFDGLARIKIQRLVPKKPKE
jgi:transcriptional regulator with XRE-family HTH domain